MKSAIPWALAVALLAACYFLYSSNQAKDAELAKLSGQTEELEKLRAENEEAKKIPALREELDRLRKDNEEMLRLRSEVQQLSKQNKQFGAQLATAQAQTAQAREAEQQQLEKLAGENQTLRSQTQDLQKAQTVVQQQAAVCINNLRQIDGAKQAWALENHKTADAIPNVQELAPYLNLSLMVCPAGGAYTVNTIGAPPTCSVPGHVLAK